MFVTAVVLTYCFLVHGLPIIEKPTIETEEVLSKDDYPELSRRGLAIYGDENRWPKNIIPYDISAITDTLHLNLITNAMKTLMYAVGTPNYQSTTRTSCVYFRPKNENDTNFLTIQYGKGCSATSFALGSDLIDFMSKYQPGRTFSTSN
ncbi:unnamed protein product [Rotaria magnacalcarata]|uniref:Uncharacterized protein n=1 Tax=Rotaria magnacalcarata TaxID=392030 RepID=A0A820C2I7_9BILA|nr:unnamed protein product [Rotaria magnacalcarata]CAF4011960.1 unnamed protein product [Rotaria magnacalcarata]CAF4200814.1 unnamed protein product [Rotaria magnacalcarata]